MDEEHAPLLIGEVGPDHRSGFVALVGKPNVGKSTLLNAWLGYRIAPVSPKPQTTRDRLLGILTREDAQVVFVDTPGIHEPRNKLGEYMVGEARRAIPDADVVVFMVDASEPPRRADEEVAAIVSGLRDVPVILTLNKTDLLTPEERQQRTEAYQSLGEFDETVLISALEGIHRDELLEHIISLLPLGPRFFPEDQITDAQERFVAAEMIREQALHLLEQEVPHALAVLVHEFAERPNDMIYISATLYTEKESQKGIVIGRKGAMLKRIGQEARVALEEFLGRKVFLELWVKVRKNWRRNEMFLRQLGYRPSRRN
ncbi:MAG TPA: GTPase Era [Chloroflexi bacterium]|jgi:GTP-binding protein Era|nr:GTPase Era [Chloroflexota bacterium]